MNLRRNVLLIDTSCYVFACYTGLASWYKNELDQAIDHDNIMDNVEFITKYTSMFKNMLFKFQRRFNIPNTNVILAKDCSRNDIWRKDIFPEYKKNRDDRSPNKFNACIFRYTYSEIIDALKETHGYKVVELDRAEADDVIALMTNAIHANNPETEVYIVSNDNDYIQLVGEHTHVIDMKCAPLHNRVMHTPQDYLMAKIIMGDKSDNIPPIAKRIGKKRASALVSNPQELDSLLKNDEIRLQYELNRKLIDFSNIPTPLRTNIEKKLCELTHAYPPPPPPPIAMQCKHKLKTFSYMHHNYMSAPIIRANVERW